MFCFKKHQNFQHFMVDIGPHLNISWLIFPSPLLLKAPELIMYACFDFIHLPHTESTQSETPCPLSQHGVRSTSTESTRIETPHQLSQWRRHQHLWKFHQSTLTQLTWSLTPVDSADVESHMALTQLTRNETRHQLSHCRMLKNLNTSGNSSTKSKTPKSLIIWPIYVWSVLNQNKKSHACVPLKGLWHKIF